MKLTTSQQKLYHDQDAILAVLNKRKSFPFVLSGGTALSRFYFHHRFSEDLDFFCEETFFSFEKIEEVVQYLRKKGWICELIGRSDQKDRLKVASYTFRHQQPIKVDFLEDPFSGMWKPVRRATESGIFFRVDALDQIYYRKLFSVVEQWHRSREVVRIKDLVDLYFLHQQHRNLEKTIAYFRENHVPVDEEKIIMILASLKKKPIQEGIQELSLALKGEKVWKFLQDSCDRLLKKGLDR